MGKFNWRALIGTVAPTLGAALGGPLGGAAGAVIAKTILGKDKAPDSEIEAALAVATPEQLAALKKADQDFAVRMRELGIEEFKFQTADVQSARQMYAINYWPQITITTLYITGYFVMTWCFITGRVTIPGEHKDMVTMLIGMLTTAIPSILGFWFGSSFGSREKTAALAASKPGDSQ